MFNPPFFKKYEVKEHELIKEWFFDISDDWINYKKHQKSESTKTDYFSRKDKPYQPLIDKHLKPYIKEFANEWHASEFKSHWWFAQYNKSGKHKWHNHPDTHFGCVYAIELPNTDICTEFYKKNNDMKEGDLIFFPAMWPHRSPINKYDNRKTVIVANISFTGIDLERD